MSNPWARQLGRVLTTFPRTLFLPVFAMWLVFNLKLVNPWLQEEKSKFSAPYLHTVTSSKTQGYDPFLYLFFIDLWLLCVYAHVCVHVGMPLYVCVCVHASVCRNMCTMGVCEDQKATCKLWVPTFIMGILGIPDHHAGAASGHPPSHLCNTNMHKVAW